MSEVRYWINGAPGDCLRPDERVVQYGDGLFETLQVSDGVADYLDFHLQRLQAGCRRLLLSFDDWQGLQAELQAHAHECGRGVIKLILGRAAGQRGYRFGSDQAATRIISTQALPELPPENGVQGVRVRLCGLRLAAQPALAGIKHLNRLEQVMARAEWHQGYEEGLMLDCDGRLIEGTMSNLFLVRDGTLFTPRLDTCGVAGVMRSVLIELAGARAIEVRRQSLRAADLASAQEVFVCNSLIGIWPVIAVDEQYGYSVGTVTRTLQQALSQDDRTRAGHWYND
jgi:4-amino-4-deoxychorismate lyase